ncbi:MAG TPA: S9 family peptidase [Porphyromonadaceae bacterium]|jgi:dipeptidyl aminopeptidase/acylaminoacyl peptidase|nr:S9 family peptidase [Porphyromonadaceae bacterium]
MVIKNFLLIICVSLNTAFSYAQKADVEAYRRYAGLDVNRLTGSLSVMSNWIGKSDFFWYEFTSKTETEYYLVDAKRGRKEKLIDKADFAAQLSALTGKKADARQIMQSGIRFPDDNPQAFVFSAEGKDFIYYIKTRKIKAYEGKKQAFDYSAYPPFWERRSPDEKYTVYAYKNNLYLQEKGDEAVYRMTEDGDPEHSFAYPRYQESKEKVRPDIMWSGDSKAFYCLRKDERNVGKLWLIDALAEPRPILKTYKYPMPHDTAVYTYDLHLFYPAGKRHAVIDIDKYPDQEVKMLEFDFLRYPDALYFTRKSRTFDEMDLCRVDVQTGKVTELIHETCKPHFTDQLFECHVVNGGQEFIWWSERNGWGQYYLYDRDGQLKNAITPRDFLACKIVNIDTIARSFIFEGYGREKGIHPEYRLYYKVNFDGSGLTLLTPGDGYHSAVFSFSKNFFVDVYSRADQEPVSELRDLRGRKIMTLETADLSALYTSGWKKPVRVKVKAADGVTDLYGVMYRPFEMDSTKKYPVITHVYPGPQDNGVPQSFELANDDQSLAQLGFIVLNVETRGSCYYRGKDFHAFGHGNLRDYPLADGKSIVEQLAARYSFIDLERVGIYGHSGGGFMAAASILTYPDFYKAAVAASGNHDNNIYMKWWAENYHGKGPVPTNMELAKNLKGKLLLVTGDFDDNVHPAQTLRLANALIEAGKRFDMMVIPRAPHGMPPYYNHLVRYYFVEHLLNDPQQGADIKF